MKLTPYEPATTTVLNQHGHIYLYDASRGEIIAQLDDNAAHHLRHHPHDTTRLTYDGNGHIDKA